VLRPETFGRKHSLVAHRRQNNLSIQSIWHSVTGSGLGQVTGKTFRPGSISGPPSRRCR